jgi:hypothetical protein
MPTILPTFQCFDDAVDAVQSALEQEGPAWVRAHLRVVHGICLAPEGTQYGEPFAHAWVELDRTFVIQGGVIDGTRQFYVCKRTEHYKLLRVQCTTVYTVDDIAWKNRETMHCGPWEPTYRALCAAKGERVMFGGEDG